MKKTNEMSKLAGVSKRTLQYYDDEGLLITERTNDNHRLYDREAMERIWEILVYKEMDFELREIRQIVEGSEEQKKKWLAQREKAIDEKIAEEKYKMDVIAFVQRHGMPPLPEEESGKTYVECIKEGIVMTYDIVGYLSSMVTETFSAVVGETDLPVLDLAAGYKELSTEMQKKLNEQIHVIGIQFSDIVIENISLPERVEELIDEQSGIGMVRGDMGTFVEYQTARAMRDAAKQEGGLAGLGAGVAFGNTIAQNVQNISNESHPVKSKAELLREVKSLFDEGILTQEEFEAEKKQILAEK